MENLEEQVIYKLIEQWVLVDYSIYNYMFAIHQFFCQFWHNYQPGSYLSSLDGRSIHPQYSLLSKVSVCSDILPTFPSEECSILNQKRFLLYRILHTILVNLISWSGWFFTTFVVFVYPLLPMTRWSRLLNNNVSVFYFSLWYKTIKQTTKASV